MTGIGRFSLPLVTPFETAVGTIERREGFLVRWGEDPVGIGEATPLPGWTESETDCRAALESMLATDPPADSDLPAMPQSPAARHGLELALLDRAAKTADRPLYRHLGGSRRVKTVPVNATVGDADVERTVEAALRAVDRGFETIKLKLGARRVEADLDRVAAVRDAVGPAVELRVDANGAWSGATALEAVDALDRQDVAVLEQPLEAEALAQHADLRGRGPDIAIDESTRRYGVDAVLEADAADVLVLKPMVLGGVGLAAKLASRIDDHGVDVIVTTTIDAAVARTAAVHLAAALDLDRACGLATAEWLTTDVASDPAREVDGSITVPQGAGHGVGVEDLD